MRKNVCYDNYYDFPFDAAIPKFTAHLCFLALTSKVDLPVLTMENSSNFDCAKNLA